MKPNLSHRATAFGLAAMVTLSLLAGLDHLATQAHAAQIAAAKAVTGANLASSVTKAARS